MDLNFNFSTPALLYAWTIGSWLIRGAALFYIPHRRPPAQARAWLFFVLLLPLPGLIAYWIFGRVYQPKRLARMRERVHKVLTRAAGQWNDRSQVEEAPISPHLDSIPILAANLSQFPLMRGNEVEIFDTHPASEDELIVEIGAARHHVHLLYYIFENDTAGRRVTEAIIQAARRGVVCRVLLDAVGAAPALKHLAPSMREAGAEVVEMLPTGIFKKKAARFDLRNHRKIAIMDGATAFVGSANITDPPCRDGQKCQEIVVRVRGPVVAQLQVVFLGDRYLEVESAIESADLFPPLPEPGKIHAHVLPSGPLHDFSHTRKVLTSLIHQARKRVCVTTPYFIPDATYINALQAAALLGVEVLLVVPRRSDNLLVTYAQESFFTELMQSGVRIFCYEPSLLHSKMITVDGEIAVVGSANMDIRSLDLNREISLICYDNPLTAKLEKVEQGYISQSTEITLEDWKARPVLRRFLQNMARLFDSFL